MARIIHNTSTTVSAYNNDVSAIKHYLMMSGGKDDFKSSVQTIIDDPDRYQHCFGKFLEFFLKEVLEPEQLEEVYKTDKLNNAEDNSQRFAESIMGLELDSEILKELKVGDKVNPTCFSTTDELGAIILECFEYADGLISFQFRGRHLDREQHEYTFNYFFDIVGTYD